ncbi:hypothetical protein CBR_g28768 [Chara braunii]|uniref:Uncharacterized protein n=1 Tax=Chara braunii TaxID=69332 RepID=A0A388L9U7_CHABU|nr:hypothetical protein CBR_g28768 [Chara braunii]|eukprot:GBG79054.1 hypothetical protein CBR_g28768 [Chara braunii]
MVALLRSKYLTGVLSRPNSSSPSSRGSQCRREGPFWERIRKTQTNLKLRVVYETHYHDHPWFSVEDAKNNPDRCGLPSCWFHDVGSLLEIVRANLPTLSVKRRESCSENPERESRGRVRTALEAILELSESTNSDVRDEMADIVQDIPQASRFSINVDVIRDIARSGCYFILLSVLQCTTSPTGASEVRLAASILARVASGLAVMPWQPCRDQRDADQQSALFTPLAGEVVEALVRLVEMCAGHHGTRANTVAGEEGRRQLGGEKEGEEDEGKVHLQETALSAVCSLAQAASEMHAHIAWVAKEPAVPSGRFCNAFSTLGPGDWPLEMPIPSFDEQEVRDFIASVVAELNCPRTERLLLEFLEVGKLKQSFQRLVADSIRIFAYLLCPRMVYWRRFETMLQDFPDSLLCSMDKLQDPSRVEAALKGLIRHCCGNADEACLSAFSKLHLAKILICQNIRDIDCQVAELLIQCLKYCVQKRGRREIDWFTCEVLDTLRDLLATSSPLQKPSICDTIASPASRCWESLVKMQDLARDRFDLRRCNASALGLAADVLENLPDKPDTVNLIGTLTGDAVHFCHVLLRRLRVERGRSEDGFWKRCWAVFLLCIITPLYNSAWRPPCTFKEIFQAKCCEADTDGMEGLEDSVHTLLLVRNVTRLLRLCLCQSENAQEITPEANDLLLIPVRLLLILRYPLGSFRLPTQLGLDELFARCVSDIRANSAVVVGKWLRLIVPSSHSVTLKGLLESYWARLLEWQRKSEAEGGPGSSSDFEGLVRVVDQCSGLFQRPVEEDYSHIIDCPENFEVRPEEAIPATDPKLMLTMRQRHQPRTVYCHMAI